MAVQCQKKPRPAFSRARIPTAQNMPAGTTSPRFWRPHADAEQGANDDEDDELHCDLDVEAHPGRPVDAPRCRECEARHTRDGQADVHELRELTLAAKCLGEPGAEERGEADQVDEDDDLAEGLHLLRLCPRRPHPPGRRTYGAVTLPRSSGSLPCGGMVERRGIRLVSCRICCSGLSPFRRSRHNRAAARPCSIGSCLMVVRSTDSAIG